LPSAATAAATTTCPASSCTHLGTWSTSDSELRHGAVLLWVRHLRTRWSAIWASPKSSPSTFGVCAHRKKTHVSVYRHCKIQQRIAVFLFYQQRKS
jgi:hypothetical protein